MPCGRADGQTFMTNQIVVFRIVANARNKTVAKQSNSGKPDRLCTVEHIPVAFRKAQGEMISGVKTNR